MKVISTGNEFSVYDDSLRTYDKLPAQSYVVRFANQRGFYLEKHIEIEITEDKVYGIHAEKVQKVLNSFSKFNRSLGVILSGNKGIGKSLFAKMLAIEAIKRNIPLIVVDKYIPGVASYLESIEQEVVVLFDEFDKTFGEVKTPEGETNPQTSLLSLFDGVSCGKKLFVITCNELHKLNGYLINRPGRFHYHFRFDYPNANEIRQYLTDKLKEEYHGEIENVIAFSRKIDLNYDCLRAIVFEINNGYSFKDAIIDLNIVNMDNVVEYNAAMRFNNDIVATCKNMPIDLFDNEEISFWLSDSTGNCYVRAEFDPIDVIYDTSRMCYFVQSDKIKLTFDKTECFDNGEMLESAKSAGVDYLQLKRTRGKSIHYFV